MRNRQFGKEHRFSVKAIQAAIVCLIMLLVACAGDKPPATPDNKPVAVGMLVGAIGGAAIGSFGGVSLPLGAAMGGIVGGAAGMAWSQKENAPFFSDLMRAHVQVVAIGEDIMLLLPSDYFFYQNSARINEAFYPSLDTIAGFIHQFQTSEIKVAGYTDVVGDPLRNLALSQQQAQNIAHYIWRAGLDARMVYSVGYGDKYPIANNESVDGRLANRRVQITFRRIPPDTVN